MAEATGYLTLPPVPSTLNPHLSPAIDAVRLRALSKQPGERFSSVAAFARAFQEEVQSSGELQATLAISRAEAQTGTTRRLTLPGGRQVSVTIPAGVGDGTTLRLEGQGMPYYNGGLVLTITILAAESPLLFRQDSEEPTVTVSMPNLQMPLIEDTRVPPVRSEAQPSWSRLCLPPMRAVGFHQPSQHMRHLPQRIESV